jgi:SAM-dependent methyltransferase
MDPSEGQVKEAIVQAEKLGSEATRIRFVQGGAEDLSPAGVAPSSVDLITAAQCAHWFDLPIFYEQAKTYLRPNGTLALWCYTRPTIANCPEMEEALRKVSTPLKYR